MPNLSLSPWTKLFAILVIVSCLLAGRAAQTATATFDDLSFRPAAIGTVRTARASFPVVECRFRTTTTFDPVYGPYWEGWAYSNMKDTTTPGYLNQYSAVTGGGVNGLEQLRRRLSWVRHSADHLAAHRDDGPGCLSDQHDLCILFHVERR